MKSFFLRVIIFLLCFILPETSAWSVGGRGNSKWAQNEVLYKLRSTASFEHLSSIRMETDADIDEEIAEIGFDTLRRLRSRSKSTEELIQRLTRNPHVAYAEPNYIITIDATPNDPLYTNLWGLTRISAPSAWDVTTGTSDVVVGVVDTGVDYTHTDLAANIWSNSGVINGCPQGTHGYNAIKKTCDPMDDNSHGTHVSGTIGAVGNNGIGVAGVNWQTKIMGLKFLNRRGSGFTSDAIAAIDWAVVAKQSGINVRVLNNSWGGGGFSQALLDEINKAGTWDILFVVAAGNDASNNDVTPTYPADYGTANEITVAATTSIDSLASFSNWGVTTVDLGAPGESIYSTILNNDYAFFSGTSMATPHVSGAAALILSACTGVTATGLKSNILTNVDPLSSLSGKVKTGGRLNVSKAIQSCRAAISVSLDASPASPQSPGTSVTFTAAASGGSGVYEYEFQGRIQGGTWGIAQAYSTNSSWAWPTTGVTPGTYEVKVNARNVGSSSPAEATQTVTYVISGAVTAVATVDLTPSPVSPQNAGTTVTFTAVANGGSGVAEYEFQGRIQGGTWGIAQAYSTNSSWVWPTTGVTPGTYEVKVNARNVGSSSPAEATQTVTYVVQ